MIMSTGICIQLNTCMDEGHAQCTPCKMVESGRIRPDSGRTHRLMIRLSGQEVERLLELLNRDGYFPDQMLAEYIQRNLDSGSPGDLRKEK